MSDGWSDDETSATKGSAAACDSDGDAGAGDNGEARDNTCRKCKQEGHMARDCEIPDTCRKCKQEGHIARDCEMPDTCRRCGEEGHKVADCTQPEQTRTVTGEDGTVREIYVPRETGDAELYDEVHTISSGINFDKYETIEVKMEGENVPKKIESFDAAGLRPLVLDNVKRSNYKKPTPVQKNAIPVIQAKRDLMACAQTGSGKTAAFLLPIISNLLDSQAENNAGMSNQKPQCVIMTPTRELAIQIHEQGRKFANGSNIKVAIAYGGTSVGFQLRNLERGCNILVATPGRLLDFVEKGRISFEDLQYFVLDEADRMLDMGFGPEIDKCMANPNMPGKSDRTTLMFSATFPTDVQTKAAEHLKEDKVFLTIGLLGGACQDVTQTFLEVGKKEKKKTLMSILNDENRDPAERTIIFVNTKKQADFIATLLSGEEKPATSIHGDRLQREREEALWDFKKGTRPILVATAVAARGLDIPNVQHVINFDMPSDVDEYVHRIGRTGRVGNLGRATSFFDREVDSEVAGLLVSLLTQSGVELPEFMGEGAEAGGDAADDEW